MMRNIGSWLSPLLSKIAHTRDEAGADHLPVQSDSSSTIHLRRVLPRIWELGKKAGAVLDPGSPIAFVEQFLHLYRVIAPTMKIIDPMFSRPPRRRRSDWRGRL